MNLMTMLEHPVTAAGRLLPWVVSTHVKDGGVLRAPGGLITFPAPIGDGIVDLGAIIRRLDTLDRPVTLSVEDHGGSFLLPDSRRGVPVAVSGCDGPGSECDAPTG